MFDLAPAGYLLTDRAGTIRQSNRTAQVLLGVRPHSLVGEFLTIFVPEDHRNDYEGVCGADEPWPVSQPVERLSKRMLWSTIQKTEYEQYGEHGRE